jgi:hypothetical protein
MTTRALLASTWDWDRAREHLRERAATATATLSGRTVRLTPEPLLDHDNRQSIRVDAAQPLSRAIVRTRSGTTLDAR